MDYSPLAITKALMAVPSVTPNATAALDVLQGYLEPLGFTCQRFVFTQDGTPDVDNLYARWGTAAPNVCFAGHLDVVPEGDVNAWGSAPFIPTERDGKLYGRGASDMKAAIACMVSAMHALLQESPPKGSLSFLITGDEEGPSINGTKKLLQAITQHGEKLDYCLVGEPTNPDTLGEMVKNGRRGSITFTLEVQGVQGHVAYPERARNPVPILLKVLTALTEKPLDNGTPDFQPSNLEITSVDVGNSVTNLIPAKASARGNIRFNPLHTGEGLAAWLHQTIQSVTSEYTLDYAISGEAFLTPREGVLPNALTQAIYDVTGRNPILSTSGGTSDARFIKDYCPVVEFGAVGASMHKVDEHIALADIPTLTAIYKRFLMHIFAAEY